MAYKTSANTQLSISNRPKALPKASPLSLVYNVEDKLSDLESIASLEDEDELDEKTDLFLGVLATKADQSWR